MIISQLHATYTDALNAWTDEGKMAISVETEFFSESEQGDFATIHLTRAETEQLISNLQDNLRKLK